MTLGTCILQVPLRRSVELAHRILTASLVCQGRLLLGVGAGSTKTDFDAIGLDYGRRMQDFDEALAVMRRLWRGDRVGAANLTPWPATLGGPKLLIGSPPRPRPASRHSPTASDAIGPREERGRS